MESFEQSTEICKFCHQPMNAHAADCSLLAVMIESEEAQSIEQQRKALKLRYEKQSGEISEEFGGKQTQEIDSSGDNPLKELLDKMLTKEDKEVLDQIRLRRDDLMSVSLEVPESYKKHGKYKDLLMTQAGLLADLNIMSIELFKLHIKKWDQKFSDFKREVGLYLRKDYEDHEGF